MQVEVRGDTVVIDGYVNAVGRDSRPIRCPAGDFVEQVEPGVFEKALKRAKNIKLLLNHRTDRELGSTADGNLTLTEDSIGLRAHAEIGDEEVIRKARNKQLSGWSFGMYVNESEMEQRSNAIPRRKLKDIDVFEVSIIDTTMLPCYAGTSVECRAEGENAALLETRAYDDMVEVTENLPENYFDDAEKQLAQLRAESAWLDAEKRLEELRYNPYHDPTNGRFTTSSGVGGGYLFVGKGEKGKGQYVIDSKEFKPKINSYQQKAMDRMNEILSKDKTISKMPEYTILDSGNIEFKYEKTEIFTKEKGGKMPDPANADTVERISEVTGTILVDEKGNRKIFGKRHNTISEKVIKKGKRTSVKNTKSSNKNSSDVSVFVINKGTPSQFFGIKTADGEVLHAPNNWKTEKGALKWAEKNGYAVSRAFGDNDIDYAEEQLAQLRAESAWLDAENRAAELRYNKNHDPNTGRFCSENGLTADGKSDIILAKDRNISSYGSGIIKSNIEIGKSLGASGKNYPVRLPNGDHSKFAEGTEIVDIRIFAGKGTNNPIREAIFLESRYGIKSSEWVKVRGTGYVLDNGSPRKAEVHWYEAEELKVKMKVKRWYDES